MMKQFTKVIAMVLCLAVLLSFAACGKAEPEQPKVEVLPNKEPYISADTNEQQQIHKDAQGNVFVQTDAADNTAVVTPAVNTAAKAAYNKGVVLVKCEENFSASALGALAYTSAEPLYKNSRWYSVKLADPDKTEEAVNYLTELGSFDMVDYDYIMGVTAEVESADISGNPAHGKQNDTFKTHNVKEGWDYLKKNGYNPGGSADVIVAVIDTGVDYTHIDLRNNIWVNTAEIPDNGMDDDGNGYIDDLCGWNCVGDNNDPLDDNGHGTHVAGIIAAENNKEGGVGVAYNCKVMVLKAGNSSGYFNNSDIAEAIQYAYMNGASVINMSFGGSSISLAVEEALENAYTTSVLVAAAGNDTACNRFGCLCPKTAPSYPAALPYVIGVMSVDKSGTYLSSFSNYDHQPYDRIEYEVYAVGEGVYSTWPGNKYATLNGTSMAAPTVAGIAALLRSRYSDRVVYSTKFIQSQIVNTGTVNPRNALLDNQTDTAHVVVDAYAALTKLPKPNVNLYDYYIDDSTAISTVNNGNGVIDAGETVRLYISLHNRGGVAANVNVSIDTMRNNDPALTDPYFSFINTAIQLSDIGTYSVRESGDKYFEIQVSSNCPNDYLVDFNVRFTYVNGLDTDDKTTYSGDSVAQFNISRGWHLPSIITQDTVFKNDRLYIIGEEVIIPLGVSVTFEEGCNIQFYDDRDHYNSPVIKNYGTLTFRGTKDAPVKLYPNERHTHYMYAIQNWGSVEINYAELINCTMHDYGENATRVVRNSKLWQTPYNYYGTVGLYLYDRGKTGGGYSESLNAVNESNAVTAEYYNNYIAYTAYGWIITFAKILDGNYIAINGDNFNDMHITSLTNNVIHTISMFPDEDSFRDTSIRVGSYDNGVVSNNYFFANNVKGLPTMFGFNGTSETGYAVQLQNNAFSMLYQKYATQVIMNYTDVYGRPTVDVYGSLRDAECLWPHVVSVEIFDKDGNPITTVGREEITVRVTFNRPMDQNAGTFLTFGTTEPYGDYRIDGAYISDTVWEGTYTLKAQIENGQNFLKINNAWAAEDQTKTVFGQYQLHEFTIDTTSAMSMNLQAVENDKGIELIFAQDDYDTLLGYNIYRSIEKDGNFVKLNRTIVLPEENTFLDENAEPGKTYWYTYTVVLSDFTESSPAGKVQATAKDTMAPSLYHTPVNQGYENNNLVISCTASDNVAIETVTLYYRTVGQTAWKALTMSKQNDKYSATIFGSDVTLAGIEYYIVAADANNTVEKGSADAPYTVVVKAAESLLGKGDVDGNGQVTTKDALMLMQCLNGDLILADDAFKRADLNGDNMLSSAEALRILQYVNGKLTNLDM